LSSRENHTASSDERGKQQPTHYTPGQVIVWPDIMLFILAYVEAVCWLGLFKILTGYISAATILLATEFFRPDGEYLTKTLVLVSFVPSAFRYSHGPC